MLENIRHEIELARQNEASLEKIFSKIWELEFKVPKEDLKQINQSAFDLATERKNTDLHSYALAQVTFGVFYFYTSDYKKALEHHLGALDNFRLLKDESGIGLSYMNMGATYRSLGDLDLAIKYSEDSIELLTKHNAYLRFLCYSHYGLAEIYLNLQSYDLSVENYKKALGIGHQINNATGVIRSLIGLGNVFLKTKDFSKSMDYLKKSLDKIDENDLVLKARILNDLGHYHFETNSFLEAKRYYEESILLRQKLNLDDAQLTSQIGLAKTFIKQNQLNEAKSLLTEGLTKALKLNVKAKLFQFHELLSKVYEALGNFQKSLEHFKSYHEVKNKVIDENSRKRIEKIKTMHDLVLERKESESNYYQETTRQLEKQKELIEQKVIERTEELQQSNEELHATNEVLLQAQEELQSQTDFVAEQNKELAQVNNQIALSINSAKTIQEAILPQQDKFHYLFAEHFIINRPKDVVSGDFYWLHETVDKTVLVVADCTGHGVSGAFMTLIGTNLLDKILKVQQLDDPAEILTRLHTEVLKALQQEKTQNNNGMDAVVITLQRYNQVVQLSFAGAKNNLLACTNGALQELKGTRKSIGGVQPEQVSFENQHITLQQGDLVYLGTDGLADQNDEKRKKFGRKRIMALIENSKHLPLTDQRQKFEIALNEHMEDTLQRDDILWMGIKL